MKSNVINAAEGEAKNNKGEMTKQWLFHGTSEDTGELQLVQNCRCECHLTVQCAVPKIVSQGFNRAFAGKNAVVYGRGVYFARDSSYSCSRTYSSPDSRGIQRMFLCRVAVGDWCRGKNGQLVPDSKTGDGLNLYDTTVDDINDPSIFVCYHDAQAYPDCEPQS